MQKTLWQKIRQNHPLFMIICCVVPIALIYGFLAVSKSSNNNWVWLIMLLCPAMHFWMMKDHDHNESCHKGVNNERNLYKCPECGFEYEEESWAVKCQQWCEKHKSCNTEIIKHAKKD